MKLLYILAFFCVSFLTILIGVRYSFYNKARDYNRAEDPFAHIEPIFLPNRVNVLPDGFVPLDEAIYDFRDYVRHLFWQTEIVFISPLESTNVIAYAKLADSKFIVIYNNEFYVDEEKINEILNYVRNKF